MVCRLTNGKLSIFLDTDALERVRCNLLESFCLRNGNLVNRKGKVPSEQEITSTVNILCNTALLLFQNNVVQIFNYLPLTKQGYFNKAKNILIKTSDLRDIFFGYEYFAQSKLQLRLIPDNEVNAHLSLDFFSISNSKEQAILDENNNFVQVEIKRNSYIKEHQVGHIYRDAKDNKYLYLGSFNVLVNNVYADWDDGCEKFANQQEYLNSNPYEEEVVYSGIFRYIKVTKKIEKIISESRNLTDVITKILNAVPFDIDWDNKIKQLENPLKVVEDCGQAVNPELSTIWFSRDFGGNEKMPTTCGLTVSTYQCLVVPR